ncbi:MAG: LacI family DNA-binding transcriptional regulator [Pseudomonadota bacterium]
MRSRKGAPGIVDVANRAGVSPATVSRYFNIPDIVRGPTRQRIEAAARDLGYIRNRMAGALHTRFSGTFGLIVPTIDNAIFAEMIEAFSARLQALDRTMLIAAHGYNLELETAIVRSLLERRIDGIALTGIDHDPVALNMLAQRDVPVISIWNHDEAAELPCVGADNEAAGEQIATHILELGHRDVALIFPDANGNDRARDRLSGVLKRFKASGLQLPESRKLQCAYDVGEVKRVAHRLLKGDAPSAIICGNDIIAHGVMFAAQSIGVEIPNQLSVVGIGDFGGSEYFEPGLTTIRLPAKRIGITAAETLLSMSETGQMPNPFHQPIEFQLKVRGSTKPYM